jgi:hypothetical protein
MTASYSVVKPYLACAHCQRRRRNRPRGLCGACWAVPDIRRQHPPLRECGKRYQDPTATGRPLPRRPTTCWPGSAGKITVLAERARRGEQLHHPLDAGSVIDGMSLTVFGGRG